MSTPDDIWIPLVDEPIGGIVDQIQRENPEIAKLVESPNRVLAFRTFAYIRVGIVLGQLLFDNDLPPYDGSDYWIDLLLKDPAHEEALEQEVRAVAEEIAADPKYADDEPLGPDDDARARFKEFARKQLGGVSCAIASQPGSPGTHLGIPPRSRQLAWPTGARARGAAGRSRP